MKLSVPILMSAAVLLSLGSVGSAQSVNLIAQPATTILPDGQSVPMWGYSCQGVVAPATCRAANPAASGGWSPVVITTIPGKPDHQPDQQPACAAGCQERYSHVAGDCGAGWRRVLVGPP